MLQPKRTKFRKAFKGRIHGDAKGGTSLNFGSYGLKAMEPERITARQIEAARRAITRHIKRQGRLWIRIFPDLPVSKNKADYSVGRWQIDAAAEWRTGGDRLLSVDELAVLEVGKRAKLFTAQSERTVYDYEAHVALADRLVCQTHDVEARQTGADVALHLHFARLQPEVGNRPHQRDHVLAPTRLWSRIVQVLQSLVERLAGESCVS